MSGSADGAGGGGHHLPLRRQEPTPKRPGFAARLETLLISDVALRATCAADARAADVIRAAALAAARLRETGTVAGHVAAAIPTHACRGRVLGALVRVGADSHAATFPAAAEVLRFVGAGNGARTAEIDVVRDFPAAALAALEVTAAAPATVAATAAFSLASGGDFLDAEAGQQAGDGAAAQALDQSPPGQPGNQRARHRVKAVLVHRASLYTFLVDYSGLECTPPQ
jgi:hypothetical protein